MAEFNFVPPPKTVSPEQSEKQKAFFVRVLLLSFLLSFIPAIVLLTISFIKNSQLSQLKRQESALMSTLEQNKEKVAKVTLIKNKLIGIKYIFDSEFDYATTLKDLFSLLPAGVDLKSVQITKTGQLEASVFASDVTILSSLIKNLNENQGKYSKVVVGEISSNNKGGYTVPIAYLVSYKDKK